jgi:eukaryotic-like serine/threonine-protein kinase
MAQGQLATSASIRARLGQSLSGRWHLDSLIGVGGMAAVYAASDADAERAAIKILHDEYVANANIRGRFEREVSVTRHVRHAGCVRVIGDGVTESGNPYFVMELLQGLPLSRIHKHYGKSLPIEYALRVADHMLDCLGACHEAGIVHRDLKPANVFITDTGQTKIIDFGVARAAQQGGELTQAGSALGTPAYMAPEQAMGNPSLDGRADIFSVGAILHLLLTGKRLQEGRSDQEALVLAATRPAPSLARSAPDLPAELVALVDRALSWDPRNRFQNAYEMRVAIDAVLRALESGTETRVHHEALTSSRMLATIAEEHAPDAASPADTAEIEASVEALRELFNWLERALAAVRQYGFEHPQAEYRIGQLEQAAESALAHEPSGFSWDVLPHSFMFRGHLVWEPVHPYDQIPYNLFASGFREFSVVPGLKREELCALLDLLRTDPGRDLSPEDDLTTLFWEKRLEHVSHRAVSSFLAVQAEDAGQDEYRELVRETGEELERSHEPRAGKRTAFSERLSLEARAIAIAARANALEAARSAGAVGLDDGTRQALANGLDLGADEWEDRFVSALVEAIGDALAHDHVDALAPAVRAAVADQAATQTLAPFLGMLLRIVDRVAAREPDSGQVRRDLIRRLLHNDTLGSVLREVGRPPVRQEDRLAIARFAGPLETLLSELGPEHFDAVLATTAHVEVEEVRPPLMKYLAHHARGNEQKLGALLADSQLGRARAILAILARLDTDAARRALKKAERNASAELRVEAVAVRAARSAGDLKEELTALSADADPAVRVAALRTMARHKLKEAGPALSQRIQSPIFHRLSAEERRLALDTLHSLSPIRAETVALEIASRNSMITRSSHDETRLVAIELLGRVSGEPKFAATLEELAKKWTNAEPVRAAAADAARAIRARLAQGTVAT